MDLNSIDTMPKEGEFPKPWRALAERDESVTDALILLSDGCVTVGEWDATVGCWSCQAYGCAEEYPDDGRPYNDEIYAVAWLPIPTKNHRLVTVEELAELSDASFDFGSARTPSCNARTRAALDVACAKVGLK